MKHLSLASFSLISALLLSSCTSDTHQAASYAASEVQVVGAMRNVMWKGELAGTIDLDSIAGKEQLYGLGPVEYLAGELLIMDGKSYKSVVVSDLTMQVEETFAAKAPFFVYAQVPAWQERSLPDSIQTMQQLELYLDSETQNSKRPFPFKVSGEIEQATIHIVNLPAGSKVSNPDEAHQGQVNYALRNEVVDIVGFFSTEHKAVFTHHDTFMHLHLITKDRSKMGHLDEAAFKLGSLTLYLPME
ncbi:acetolactate decarboxylase [Pontibacter sp. HSC-14F20]|uniref:acetolactate decarboxylase n=1 Tax=Pontibacter sp. HSC-14F20 TaxID=2864136 RepID=UPI001C73A9FE|nr:acetolactate decarboxylase [Pontibacter sp. HSC-14F20]MBX0334718.1 acetolactate decarboxylase [Pontibacter sp. HSC-14F20]